MAVLSQAQSAQAQAGPRIFVDTSSMITPSPTGSGRLEAIRDLDDFNIYLAAAVWKKHVNVIITTDRSKADFILEGVLDHQKLLGWKSSIFDDWAAPVLAPARYRTRCGVSASGIQIRGCCFRLFGRQEQFIPWSTDRCRIDRQASEERRSHATGYRRAPGSVPAKSTGYLQTGYSDRTNSIRSAGFALGENKGFSL
jgi:hypothetical protein